MVASLQTSYRLLSIVRIVNSTPSESRQGLISALAKIAFAKTTAAPPLLRLAQRVIVPPANCEFF
jgi:hypothetical protein